MPTSHLTLESRDRYQAALDMRRSGAKIREIAEKFCVSKARAGQMINTAIRLEQNFIDTSGLCASLSTRITRILQEAGLETVGQVRSMSDYELMRLPKFGRMCLRELRAALEGKASEMRI